MQCIFTKKSRKTIFFYRIKNIYCEDQMYQDSLEKLFLSNLNDKMIKQKLSNILRPETFTLYQVSPSYKTSGAHYFILPKALPLAQIALTGSIYSTLAITIERYLIVCHPFYTVSHKWSAWRYIVPIVTFSFGYNAPKFFELETGVRQVAEVIRVN